MVLRDLPACMSINAARSSLSPPPPSPALLAYIFGISRFCYGGMWWDMVGYGGIWWDMMGYEI